MVNAVAANLRDLNELNYVRKADPKGGYWFSFYVGKIQARKIRFGNDFFLIVHGASDMDNDYFVIPYEVLKDVLIDENTSGIGDNAKDANTRTPRWTGNIINSHLHVTHSGVRIDLTEYYGNRRLLEHAMGHSVDEVGDQPQLDAESADNLAYDPENVSDGRNRITRTITQRRGQKTLRDKLLDAYGRQCSITGCGIVDVLEAAHITPYLGPDTNHVANGLLLRADLHTLLDCRLIAIEPATLRVMLAPIVRKAPDYWDLHGQRLRAAVPIAAAPSRKALDQAILGCDWFSAFN
jgi:hypothetical protein